LLAKAPSPWNCCASTKARLDAVFVAIGGGGLISGVANYIKAVRPEVKVIGVQMDDSVCHAAIGHSRQARHLA
jgi:threonine dehydratase